MLIKSRFLYQWQLVLLTANSTLGTTVHVNRRQIDVFVFHENKDTAVVMLSVPLAFKQRGLLWFWRARLESANRFFKSMILPVLDCCGAVFHERGKGNEEGLKCLQRRGGWIVLNTAHLSTEQMVTSLGWVTLTRRENLIVKQVEECLKGMASSYFSKYFQIKRHNIHH